MALVDALDIGDRGVVCVYVLCAVCKACICRSFKVAEPKMELLNPRQFFSTLLQREQHFFRLSTKTG